MNDSVTRHGRQMARLGLHPRLAHMILMAKGNNLETLACDVAALLNGRDLFRSTDQVPEADLRLHLEALRTRSKQALFYGYPVDEKTRERVLMESKHWRKVSGIRSSSDDIEACGIVLAFAYPDRLA